MALAVVKRSLVAMLVVTGLFSAQADDPVVTSGELNDDQTVLVVKVDSGTATFDPAKLGATVTDLVKTGSGTLTVSSDLAAYQGRITIAEGVYQATLPTAVGDVTSGKGGAVEVAEEATLEFVGNGERFTMPKKAFVISGTGVDGRGAVVYSGSGAFDKASLGNDITLNADTLVAVEDDFHVYWNNSPTDIHLNGHVLTLKPYAGRNFILAYLNSSDSQGGKIVLDDGLMSLMNPEMALTDDGVIEVGDTGTLEMSSVYGDLGWALKIADGGKLQAKSNLTADQVATTINAWSGPLTLGGESTSLKFAYNQAVNAVNFKGKVSGGGLTLTRDSRVTNAQLHLHHPENDFEGGVTAAAGIDVYLWNPTAMPAYGGALSLTAGSLYLKAATAYELPAANFSEACAVQGGIGAWQGTVTKSGAGELDYNSAVDGQTLAVAGGTVRFHADNRAKIAGLYEGQFAYRKNTRPDYTDYFSGKNFTTNSIAMGPMCAYDAEYPLWTLPNVADGDTRAVICYRGYLWNNSDAPVDWAFAGSAAHTSLLKINDVEVFKQQYNVSGVKYIGHGTATLQPGANAFLYVVYAGGLTGNGPNSWFSDDSPAAQGKWKGNFGLAVNKAGYDTMLVDDYEALVDPGDGSLFTYALVSDVDVVRPGVVIPPADDNGSMPSFAAMEFAPLTGIDFGRVSQYRLFQLTGLPTVANCGSLTVESTWAVDAAELAEDGSTCLTTAGKLQLGEELEFQVQSAGAFKSVADGGRYLIATAAAGIEMGAVTVTSDRASAKFELELSADGKSLYLVKREAGTVWFLR